MGELFKKSRKYKILVQIGKEISYYTCSIIFEDDLFVTILDKNNREISINKNSIKTFRELDY